MVPLKFVIPIKVVNSLEVWINQLKKFNILISHDGVGRCIDNVRIERFWRTLKYEDVYLNYYQSLREAKIGINKFIDHYNFRRPHQAFHYARPIDFFLDNLVIRNLAAGSRQSCIELCLEPAPFGYTFQIKKSNS